MKAITNFDLVYKVQLNTFEHQVLQKFETCFQYKLNYMMN